MEIQGRIEAMTSRIALRCPASSGGCVGADNTFVWRQYTNSCDMQKVGKITGFLEKEAGIFTSTSALATLNISHGLKTLSSSCTAERVGLYKTQYRTLMLYIGEQDIQIEEVKEDVDVETIKEVTQDSLQRLIYRVDDLVETADELAQCRSQAKLTDGELAITDQAGVYVVVTGEAILEVQCTRIQVRRTKH